MTVVLADYSLLMKLNDRLCQGTILGEQGWCCGEGTRLPPVWPGFKFRRRSHVWVEFAVGSLPCSNGFFSGYSVFTSPKNQHTLTNLTNRTTQDYRLS